MSTQYVTCLFVSFKGAEIFILLPLEINGSLLPCFQAKLSQ